MSLAASASPIRKIERRRSERLPFRETLFVCGCSQGHAFREETLTICVSAHGALVPLSARLSAGQKVLLMNPQTWDEREGRVARVGKIHNERTEIAIEFATPAPEFWPLRARTKSIEPNLTTKTLLLSSALPGTPV